MSSTDRLEVGHVGKAHGLRGEVVVRLTSDRVERLDKGSVLYAGETALTVGSSRPHQERHLVHFQGVADRNQAEALTGSLLTADPMHDPDTLWVHELVGCAVTEVDGTQHGTVTSVEDNPASDLLVLDTGALVPLTFLVEKQGNVLMVDTPKGLFAVTETVTSDPSDPTSPQG